MSDDLETKKIGSGKPGPGRPKGMQNKATSLLKNSALQALEEYDGGPVAYFKWLMVQHAPVYGGILGKILPTQVEGGDGGGIILNVITGVPRDGED